MYSDRGVGLVGENLFDFSLLPKAGGSIAMETCVDVVISVAEKEI